jgi:hypothetical protein
MSVPGARKAILAARRFDTLLCRYRDPQARDILLDVRTSMEYAMMSPVHEALAGDSRVRVWLTASERPELASAFYRDAAAPARHVSPRRAMAMRFDVYLAANLVWAALPRGTCRVQMFHGVAGKYGHLYDRPERSMREWQRLFFINERRLRNFVAAGAIDGDSEAIRLVGMPKADCLVDGTLRRDAVLASKGLDPARRTVLYAPTWTPYSSLNAMGEDVIRGLIDAGYTVLVKPHDYSFDMAYENSGGIDWAERLGRLLRPPHAMLVREANAAPWLVAADVLISDHSSIAFEYLLLNRPVVRIEMPALISRAGIPEEYVSLMASASITARTADQVLTSVERAFADPGEGSQTRSEVAADLFYRPGGATARAVRELYQVMELAAPQQAPATERSEPERALARGRA